MVTPATTHGAVVEQAEGYVGVIHQLFGPGEYVTGQADGCGDKHQDGDDSRGMLYTESCPQESMVQMMLVGVEGCTALELASDHQQGGIEQRNAE